MTGFVVKIAKRLTLSCISIAFGLGMTLAAQSPNAVPVSSGPVITPYNTPAINAPVRVCLSSSVGTPCNTAGVTLYSDSNVSQSIGNPTATNAQGLYSFYLNSSQYSLPQFFIMQIIVSPTVTYQYSFSVTAASGISVPVPISQGGTGATTAAAGAANIVNGNPIAPSSVTAGATGTVTIADTEGVCDYNSTLINPLCPLFHTSGNDMGQDIDNAGLWAENTKGWTNFTIDACKAAYQGAQPIAHNMFAGWLNNGTVTATVKTCGANIEVENSAIPTSGCGPTGANNCLLVVPGGTVIDGMSSRPSATPRALAGTTIQPYSAQTGVYVVSLGSSTDTSSPQGVMLKNIGVSCLPPGGSYVAGQYNTAVLNANAQQGSGLDNVYVFGCQSTFDVEGGAVTPGSHTANNEKGASNVQTVFANDPLQVGMTIGGCTQGTGATGTATISSGVMTISSTNNGSSYTCAPQVAVTGCSTAIVTAAPSSGTLPSSAYTVVSAGGCADGSYSLSVTNPGVAAGVGNPGVFQNDSFNNPPNTNSGNATNTVSGIGIGIDDETANGIFINNNYEYLSTDFEVGTVNSASHTYISGQSGNADYENSTDYFINLGPYSTGVTISGASSSGILSIVSGTGTGNYLYDSLYPGGACSWTAAANDTLAAYYRPGTHGSSGVVFSTATGACPSKNTLANAALTNAANTFSASQTIGDATGTQRNLIMAPTSTATSGSNGPSNQMILETSIWNGSAAVTSQAFSFRQAVGSGTTPSSTLNITGLSTAASNTANWGTTTTPILVQYWTPPRLYNSAGTYYMTWNPNSLTGTTTMTPPVTSGPWTAAQAPLVGTTASWNNGGSAISANTCVNGPTVSITGAATTMAISVTPAGNPGLGLTWNNAYISSGTTVQIQVCNVTGTGITPTAETYNVRMQY